MFWSRWLGRGKSPSRLTPELEQRIRRSFDEASRDEEHFPSAIDPRIYHVRLLLDHLGDVGNRRVLDIGCGKGRFARLVQDRNPRAEVWGLDISGEMLRYVPPPLRPCVGTMTALPFPDGAFYGAYATESLEHAVDVERAVAEMCRVLAPGGRLLIIDKNQAACGRLRTEEWEQWFDRRRLERMLRGRCRLVESRPVSYWEDVEPDGLFLAWLAEK